jgi:biopolymer transport protein ExbD
MFPPSKRGHEEDLIDMTAMVDIVFFLLIFFLVTSMQAVAAVLDMPKPEQAASSQAVAQNAERLRSDPGAILVKIDADDSIWIDDDTVFGDSALREALERARDDREADPPVLVIGSPDASHGAAVRVLDACASSKLTNVRFLIEADDEGP